MFFLSPRLYRRLSLLLVGLVPGLCVGVPFLRLELCLLQPAIVPVAIPPSSRIGPTPSRWVPLLGARCVWGLQPFARNGGVASASPVYSFGMWSPFGSSVSFRHS